MNDLDNPKISDAEMVTALRNRISHLIFECAAKDAYITQLRQTLDGEEEVEDAG